MLYKCDRCGYTGSQRSNLTHHLERKKICKPILSDISIENIAQNFNIYLKKTVPKIFQNGTKPVPKLEYFFDSKMEPNSTNSLQTAKGDTPEFEFRFCTCTDLL